MGVRNGVWLAVVGLAADPTGSAIAADTDPAPVAALDFLDVDEANRIYVDLAPDGSEPFRMLLDTSASDSVMTPLAARAAGVSVRKLKSTPYRRTTRLGRDIQFWVDTGSSDTGSQTGWEYGLLGGSFLREYVVELDFAKRQVRFLDSDEAALPKAGSEGAEGAVLSIRDSTRPVGTIAIGGKELPVLFDTGSPHGLILSGSAARRVGIDVDALPRFGTLHTVIGATELRFYEVPDLEIGGFHFANVPVLVSPHGWFGQAGEANDSVIGYDLLSRFLVRIDYRGRRMLLRRQSEQVVFLGVEYAPVRESGAFLYPRKVGWQVVAVLPGSPAERLGLRSGDFIARVRGSDTPEATLRAIAAGKPINVKREQDGIATDVELRPTAVASP